MNNWLFRRARTILRTFGWKGLWRRLRHEWRRRLNGYLPAPRYTLLNVDPTCPPCLHPHGAWVVLPAERRDRTLRRGEQVLAGFHESYGMEWRPLPGSGEAWKTDPVTGYRFPDAPWWRIETLPPEADIKDLWEPGRFLWVYDLIRAHALTGQEKYAAAFHARLADWVTANPPFSGVHWACGQETAIRALAILHAADALPWVGPDPEAARSRVMTVLGWSGERIADAIDYGLSQRNNHGISETAALVHLGLRLHGHHPAAAQWLRRGQRLLEEQILDQFAEDGWYAQHSFNYQRLALEQAVLAQRALRHAGRSLSPAVLDRLSKGLALLVEVVDAATGEAPNHGSNDGALLIRYATAPFRDLRPAITLAATVLGKPVPEDIPLDPEVLTWLGLPPPERMAARPDGVVTGSSGWASARLKGAQVFLRAGRYTHRPSHLDLLHLDVRLGGGEVVVDPGTYAYNRPPVWKNALAAARLHNGPVVDDREPGERGPRFLWYSWPKSRLRRTGFDGRVVRLEAEIPGRVARSVVVGAERFEVHDRALDPAARSLEVNWLLAPGLASGESPLAGDVVSRHAAREGDVRGWFSPSYGVRLASVLVTMRKEGAGTALQLHTTISRPQPGGCNLRGLNGQ